MQLSVGAIADILQTRPLYSKALSEEERDALARVMVRGASIDSRTVSEGDLFVCLKGEKVDGHDYAARACEAGAAAILASRDIEGLHEAFPTVPLFVVENPEKALGKIAHAVRMRFAGKVIGVTGTAGKTTLKEWLYSLISQEYRCARTEGNHNNQLGLPLTICNTCGDEDYWVIEAGISHAGDMEELAGILRPDIGVVLNAGTGHTEGLGAMGVAWHKTRMFTVLADKGYAVTSSDYPDLEKWASEACEAKGSTLYFFSVARDRRDFVAKNSQPGIGCVTLVDRQNPRLCHVCARRGDRVEETIVTMPMAGRAAAENLACVTLVASLLRLDLCFLQKAIEEASVPDHRYSREVIGKSIVIDDCYNANPLSMGRMVEAAATESRQGAFIPVLGAMGELGAEAANAHKILGAQLKSLAPAFVLWKGAYAQDVREGLGPDIPLLSFETDEECAQCFSKGLSSLSMDPANEGVTVLVKGSRSNRLETAAQTIKSLLTATD